MSVGVELSPRRDLQCPRPSFPLQVTAAALSAGDGSLLKSITWSGTITGSVSKAYDSDFRVSSEQVNTGAAVAYTYDPDSLLTGAGALSIAVG